MLNVPYQRQQHDRWCGPATLAMVLAYYGCIIQQRDIASEVMRGDLSFADDLSSYAARYGFEVFRLCGMDDNLAISKLRELLDDGIPPIVIQHPLPGDNDGHFRVVIDVKNKSTVVHDPKYGSRRRYRKQEFLQLWKADGPPIEDDNIIIIVRRPKAYLSIDSCPYCGRIPHNENMTCNMCQQTFQFSRGFPIECSLCHSQWTEIRCNICNKSWTYFKPVSQ